MLHSNVYLSRSPAITWNHTVTLWEKYEFLVIGILIVTACLKLGKSTLRTGPKSVRMASFLPLASYERLNFWDNILSLSFLWKMHELDKIISNVLFNYKLLELLSSWQINHQKSVKKLEANLLHWPAFVGALNEFELSFIWYLTKRVFWQVIQNTFSMFYADRGRENLQVSQCRIKMYNIQNIAPFKFWYQLYPEVFHIEIWLKKWQKVMAQKCAMPYFLPTW